MKKNVHSDDWLVYGIVLLTSSTTVLTMLDGTLFGLLRGIGFAFVLDGLILFWESRSEVLTGSSQRTWSNGMKWAGVGMLVTIAMAYVFMSLVPVDAKKTVDVFGLVFSSTLRELVHWIIVGVISLWVVLTLGVLMYIRGIDPETRKRLELVQAHEATDKEELRTYKVALGAIKRTRGVDNAIKRMRLDLENEGRTPAEIDELVNKAMLEIMAANGEAIPVNIGQPENVNRYQADAEAAPNFTKPLTAKK